MKAAKTPADVGAVEPQSPLATAVAACREHLIYAAVFSAFLNVLFLAPSLYMLQVYDRAVPTRGVTTLLFLTALFVFALGTLSGLDHIRTRLLTRASVRLDRRLAPALVGAILSRSATTRSSEPLREFDALRQTLTGPAVPALLDAPWTPIYIGICFLLHPALGGLALVGGAALLAITALNERATKAPQQRAHEHAVKAYQMLDQTAASTGVVRALGMKGALVDRHLGERMAFVELQAKVGFESSGYLSLIKFLRLLLQSLALGLGAYLSIRQEISGGAIFAASLLVTRALAPVEQIVGAWRSLVSARGAYAAIEKVFQETPAERPRTRLPDPTGQVQVDNVSVATPALDRFILQGVSFDLKAGESLGVVGPSGAGKSTLARVVAGALDPLQGAVRFDGAEGRDWDETQLARHIGYVPQEPTLFPGTIRDNIARFRAPGADGAAALDAHVVSAARACGAHDLIVRLPQAYETLLGPNGSGLSAGQAQRVALARAFFGKPRLIILDEPNAHLDTEGEMALIEAMARLRLEGITVIAVAHRMGILQSVDKLLVLNSGRMVGFGPREEINARLQGGRAPAPRTLHAVRA